MTKSCKKTLEANRSCLETVLIKTFRPAKSISILWHCPFKLKVMQGKKHSYPDRFHLLCKQSHSGECPIARLCDMNPFVAYLPHLHHNLRLNINIRLRVPFTPPLTAVASGSNQHGQEIILLGEHRERYSQTIPLFLLLMATTHVGSLYNLLSWAWSVSG